MAPALHDNVSRVKRINRLGITTFVGLRSADVVLQYGLLHWGWGAKLIESFGGHPLPRNQVVSTLTEQLLPYHSIVLLMAVGSSLKQIITMLAVSEQDTPPSSALVIALFNTVFNFINTVFSLWEYTSKAPAHTDPIIPGWSQSSLTVALYMAGILTELVSELQRTYFKKQLANSGKPYANGLFSLARHINYGGYTIWRAMYALYCGGWPWGLTVFSFFFYDFATRGVPVLDIYLTERYGEQWKDIKLRVPYRLIPGVY
ncbi:unnamed protein product [Clonostachys rosea]|uniref:Steroid 5-alpha reductase C-terminal domain-containing protein n=1 Tax=Bionectria ochroleuca TaxID=29856 RepID=A0ABY6ULD6_BIOOC|nr:unnamed protein product [Clonostachys rosea]